jgi:outer membrane protein assembly factor BamB
MIPLTAVDAASANDILEATGVKGGLVVHLHCGDGKLTAALRANERYLVHGLATDPEKVETARKHIREQGLYGDVSVSLLTSKQLPYRDNLVNLMVIGEPANVPDEEILRVLAPRGTAVFIDRQSKIENRKLVKPWPDDIDEWTHFLHGPNNNAVARDRVVGPPDRLQWLADPIHLRSHEHLNSISAVVSAGGRIFYVIDEGARSAVIAPPDWKLVARDAFNGVLLWKQKLGPWEGTFRLFRSGPPEIGRRLVAAGEHVYVTLGYEKQVAAFDAATGEKRQTYPDTKGAVEIVCDHGRLFVVVGKIDLTPPADPGKRHYPPPAPKEKGIVVVEAESGKTLWKKKDKDTESLMPTTLAVSQGKVFYQNTRQVVCLDASSGEPKWSADRPVFTKRLSWSAPTLVVADGVVLSADGSTGGTKGEVPKGGDKVTWILSDQDIRKHPVGDLAAFSAEDGKPLWSGVSLQGFCNPGDVFVIDGKVWAGADVATKQALLNTAVDLKTGKVLSRRPNNGMPVGGHTRCYRNKATERYLLLGDIGVDFVDVKDWSWNANPWVRGTCQYGVMPCNGLLYAPSDSCACRPEMRLHGFAAMAPVRSGKKVAPPERLLRGPAYDAVQKVSPAAADDPWPTYRHDGARTGRTEAQVPDALKTSWRAELGGKLTSPTIGAGKVFVARVDTHTLYAIDSNSGKTVWSRTAGGAVDSPPTVRGGLVFFGSHDGHVYCLRADDGALVWRFRAGPDERLLVAMQRVESAWPVHGSVLFQDGKIWFSAGRSSYLDDGIRVCAVEPLSGKLALEKKVFAREAHKFHTARTNSVRPTPPSMPDILSATNGTIYMRWMGFDAKGEITKAVKPHLFSATGFLDDTWWHRTYWQYGTWMGSGFGGWPQAAMRVPAGRVMVVGDEMLFSYGRTKYDAGNGGNVHAGHIGLVKRDYQDMGKIDHAQNPYRLYAIAKTPAKGGTKGSAKGKGRGRPSLDYRWRAPVPMLVRSMVLADQTLLIAGPVAGEENKGLAELTTPSTGLLWAVSPSDGKKQTECALPSAPVLDGMAVVPGRLIISCTDGSVCCLDGK